MSRRRILYGRFSCRECRAILAVDLLHRLGWYFSYRSHAKSLHPHTVTERGEPIVPGSMAAWNPQDHRFAAIVASHHYAPDGSWVSAIRECQRKDGTPKKVFLTMDEATSAAACQGKGKHAYKCSHGHYHVGKLWA